MYRLILSWVPTLVRQIAGPLVVGFAIAAFTSLLDFWPRVFVLLAVCLVVAAWFRSYYVQLFRFAKATWGFRHLDGERVTLRYSPRLAGRDLAPYVRLCEGLLAEFSQRFGFPLKYRLVVFLFDSIATMNRVCKTSSGGYALVGGDAVVLGFDGLVGVTLAELFRHEVSHLFAARLGKLEPALKAEGLATFLQGSHDGKPLDFHALAYLLTDRYLFLTWLTVPGFFGSDNSYVMVGSFTAHLVERFGWECYTGFFRRATAKNFDQAFADAFGLSLMMAERQWRDDLVARRQRFEPELSRVIGEANLVAAYEAGQLLRCLEVSESLGRAGPLSSRALIYAATAHGYLCHYEQAVEMLEQAIQRDDQYVRAWSGQNWLLLGRLYDLMDNRDKAVAAYERVLGEPDTWTPWYASTHNRARQYLRHPFNEAALRRELRELVRPVAAGQGGD